MSSDRAAAWLAKHDEPAADNSVPGWWHEHRRLHKRHDKRALTLISSLSSRSADLIWQNAWAACLEAIEHALIDARMLPALGFWIIARQAKRRVAPSRCAPERTPFWSAMPASSRPAVPYGTSTAWPWNTAARPARRPPQRRLPAQGRRAHRGGPVRRRHRPGHARLSGQHRVTPEFRMENACAEDAVAEPGGVGQVKPAGGHGRA